METMFEAMADQTSHPRKPRRGIRVWTFLLFVSVAVGTLGWMWISNASLHRVAERLKSIAEFNDARVDMWSGTVELRNVRFPFSTGQSTNWLTADSVQLQVEPQWLLKRPLVVERGALRNVVLADSSAADDSFDPLASPADDRHGAHLSQWLNYFSGDSLQTPLWQEHLKSAVASEAERIEGHWLAVQSERQRLADSIVALTTRLNAAIDRRPANPLRPVTFSSEVRAASQAAESSLVAARQRTSQLRRQIQRDAELLAKARHKDLAQIREREAMLLAEEPEWSCLLVGEYSGQRLHEILCWIRSLQAVARSRTLDVAKNSADPTNPKFSSSYPLPLAVRSLRFNTRVRFANQAFSAEGWVGNFGLHGPSEGEPCRVQLTAEPGVIAEAAATLDRRDGETNDRVVIRLEQWPVDVQTLGEPGVFALRVEPCRMDVLVEFDQTAEAIDGKVTLSFRDVRLAATSGIVHYGPPEQMLDFHSRLATIRQFENEFRLGGRWDRLQITSRSDLAPTIAEATRSLAERHRIQSFDRERASIDREYRSALAHCEQLGLQELALRELTLTECLSRVAQWQDAEAPGPGGLRQLR